jgi:hypothetical protein
MVDGELLDLRIYDAWDTLPEVLRQEFLARRTAATEWVSYQGPKSDGKRWEPLRPMVIGEQAYRDLEALSVRLLHLAVDACRRRASTFGELHRVLRYSHDLPLMDPDRPLVAAELTRYARPDILIEQGRPRFLELNNGTRLGGKTEAPRLAEAYARLCPHSGLRPPPSTVTARSAALARTLRADVGRGARGRLLLPGYRTMDSTGALRRHGMAKPPMVTEARRLGLEVVQADLVDLRVDASGRLLAADAPIDLVLIGWGCHDRIVGGGGLAALRTADRAGTVQLFPRTESILISSKAVLAWLHEDCDAGLLNPADRALVRTHVPWTACLGLDQDPAAHEKLLRVAADERDQLVAKPADGKSGNDVLFGNQIPERDWLAVLVRASRRSPLVLQRRVESAHLAMPFRDRDSGQQTTAPVPFVLSPFIIGGAAASVSVRHMGPGDFARDVVISARQGACGNTVLLAPEPSVQCRRGGFGEGDDPAG